MINEGTEPLVYLCISASAQKVDVVAYPDSKKVAASAGTFEKRFTAGSRARERARLLARRARRAVG